MNNKQENKDKLSFPFFTPTLAKVLIRCGAFSAADEVIAVLEKRGYANVDELKALRKAERLKKLLSNIRKRKE